MANAGQLLYASGRRLAIHYRYQAINNNTSNHEAPELSFGAYSTVFSTFVLVLTFVRCTYNGYILPASLQRATKSNR